jgi:uncharacterized YccA/Bax inhibitor family protein
MALWHLLVLICFGLPIGSSLAAAQHANARPGGYVLAVILGVIVGGCCAWVMWATHKTAVKGIKQQQPSRQAWSFPALYLVTLLWIMLAGFLGFWVPSMLLRFLGIAA